MCDPFDWVNNKRSSMIASQYFLLCKQSSIAFINECHNEGEMFNPIGFHWYECHAVPKYGSILQYHLEFSDSLIE